MELGPSIPLKQPLNRRGNAVVAANHSSSTVNHREFKHLGDYQEWKINKLRGPSLDTIRLYGCVSRSHIAINIFPKFSLFIVNFTALTLAGNGVPTVFLSDSTGE